MTANVLQGIFPDMSNEEHHAHPAIGSSGLKLIKEQSPLHYWDAYVNPERERKAPTQAMLIGTAWHCAVFEPEAFSDRFGIAPDISAVSTLGKLLKLAIADLAAFEKQHVAIPDGIKTSKAGKELIAELEAAGKTAVEQAVFDQILELAPPLVGKDLFSAEDTERIHQMAKAARAHTAAGLILNHPDFIAEASMFWVDPVTGVNCKIRPDGAIRPCKEFPNGLLIDGKSGDDASPEGFGRSAWNWMMFLQAAFYSDGFQQVWKTPAPPAFLWLSQERDSPYACAMYSAPEHFVAYGRHEYQRLLRTVASCQQTGKWPGYPAKITPLVVPGFAAKTIAEVIGEAS